MYLCVWLLKEKLSKKLKFTVIVILALPAVSAVCMTQMRCAKIGVRAKLQNMTFRLSISFLNHKLTSTQSVIFFLDVGIEIFFLLYLKSKYVLATAFRISKTVQQRRLTIILKSKFEQIWMTVKARSLVGEQDACALIHVYKIIYFARRNAYSFVIRCRFAYILCNGKFFVDYRRGACEDASWDVIVLLLLGGSIINSSIGKTWYSISEALCYRRWRSWNLIP